MRTKAANQETESEFDGDGFDLNDFLPYKLAVAASSVSRLMGRRFAEAHGLAISEWRVLAVVGRIGTLSPSAVGSMAAMDKVKVSRAAASLVARGLIKQTQDPEDGRGRLLRLTRKGASVHRGLTQLARELESELAQGLSSHRMVIAAQIARPAGNPCGGAGAARSRSRGLTANSPSFAGGAGGRVEPDRILAYLRGSSAPNARARHAFTQVNAC